MLCGLSWFLLSGAISLHLHRLLFFEYPNWSREKFIFRSTRTNEWQTEWWKNKLPIQVVCSTIIWEWRVSHQDFHLLRVVIINMFNTRIGLPCIIELSVIEFIKLGSLCHNVDCVSECFFPRFKISGALVRIMQVFSTRIPRYCKVDRFATELGHHLPDQSQWPQEGSTEDLFVFQQKMWSSSSPGLLLVGSSPMDPQPDRSISQQ